MADLRTDYLTGDMVTMAASRQFRPHEKDIGDGFACPFCPEHADMLTAPVYISASGRVRSVMNLYPAFDTQNPNSPGFHEVVIDTPDHHEKFHAFSIEHMAESLSALQNRAAFYADGSAEHKDLRYVQIFKNQGQKAGASINHSHWQVVAMPAVPVKQQTILKNFRSYYDGTGRCYLCDSLQNAHAETKLAVWEDERALAYVPPAMPYQMGFRVMPKAHFSTFAQVDEQTLFSLATALKHVLTALRSLHEHVAYNICFQDMPLSDELGDELELGKESDARASHFFIQVIPRLGNLAGFELSTGCYINSSLPEEAAGRLRNICIGKDCL